MNSMPPHRPLSAAIAILLPILLMLLLPAAGPAREKPAPAGDTIRVEVSPKARTTIYSRVLVLPFLDRDGQANTMLTRAFYQALQQARKYPLLPLETGQEWYDKHIDGSRTLLDRETAVRAGREIRARGVITGTSTLESHSDSSSTVCRYQAAMTDAQTEEPLWSLSFSAPPDAAGTSCDTPGLREILDQAIRRLVAGMVRQGDIYSPLLPDPKVLATQGEIRKIRIVLRPDPPHIYSAYQLLRADRPDGVFHVVAGPVANDHAPIVLKDENLKDATTYYYTIIGLNAEGMANVPAPPLAITTTGPPAPVSRLHASGNGLRSVRLLWEPSQDPTVTGYVIYRSSSRSGPYEKIAVVNGHDQQTYTDLGRTKGFSRYGRLRDNTVYYYIVRARNYVNVESADSRIVSALTKGAPPPPTGLKAIDHQPRQVPLTWSASPDPDVKGYAIFRSEREDGPFTQIDFVSGRLRQEFVDQGTWGQPLADNTRYFYRLQAVNVVDVNSENSATVSATTKPVPTAVTGVRASHNLYRSVELSWQPNPEPDITRYEIFRGTIEDNTTRKVGTVPAPATRFTDTYLPDGAIYWYRIRAIDVDGLEGAMSQVIQATTKPVPVPPAGLTARLTADGILLEWQKNPEQDIQRYEIVTAGFLATQVGQAAEPSFLYRITPEPGQEFRFQVRAVDSDGLKSPYSAPVAIRVPGGPERK